MDKIQDVLCALSDKIVVAQTRTKRLEEEYKALRKSKASDGKVDRAFKEWHVSLLKTCALVEAYNTVFDVVDGVN